MTEPQKENLQNLITMHQRQLLHSDDGLIALILEGDFKEPIVMITSDNGLRKFLDDRAKQKIRSKNWFIDLRHDHSYWFQILLFWLLIILFVIIFLFLR